MGHIDYVTQREKSSGVKDKHTITQITFEGTEKEREREKKKCFHRACGVDGQCFPLVVLESR